MLDLVARLFDSTGFTPRSNCGDGWTPLLVWLHIAGDLFIWLAYISIPLVMLYFVRNRRDFPFQRLFVLFSLFIFACGFGHFIEALMFEYPMYRLAGVWKVVTATISWITVVALMAVTPRVLQAVATTAPGSPPEPTSETALLIASTPQGRAQVNDYIVGVLAAVLAMLLRAAIDPLVHTDHFYVISLLAVVFVSWHSGFGPAIVTLILSMIGMVYFFVSPIRSFAVVDVSNQLATSAFFFCGVFCAALGETQRRARMASKEALTAVLQQKDTLAAEVARRGDAEETARESEGRFRSMADSVPALIWLSDTDRHRTYFNKTWLEFTGRTTEQELGDGWIDNIHPEDRDRYLGEYVAAFEAHKPFEVEYRLLRHDGLYRWVLARGTPRLTPSGVFTGFVGLCLDVSDRKRAEEDLRRSERNLADFFENANVGLHWVGPDGTILRANRAELEMLGYRRKEYVGRKITDFHADEDTITDILARLQRGEGLDNYPARLKRKDGSIRDVLISSSGLWEDGRFIHSRCFTRDVTELKRAEQNLRQSEERFRLMAQTVPSILWTAAPDGAITWVNDRWLEYCGLTRERNTRVWPELILHPDDEVECRRQWSQALAEGTEYEIEVRYRRHDGEYRWFITRAVPVRDGSGSVRAWFGATTDIDDRKKFEDRLRGSEERFRTLTEAIPQIVWNAGADGKATYFNKRWLDYTGLPPDQAHGRGWLDAVHPDDRERVAAEWAVTVRTAAPGPEDRFSQEIRLHGEHNDEYRWFLSVAVPLRRPDGTIDRWIGSMADIHDQKTSAQLVEEANHFLESTINALSSHIAVLDGKGTILKVNAAWKRFGGENGLRIEDAGVGANYLEACDTICANEDELSLSGSIREVIEGTKQSYQTEYPCHSPTEEWWFQMRVNRFPGDGPVRVVVAHENITGRVLAEQAVREREEKFRTLADNMSQFAWMTDETGARFWFNRRWFDYTGATLDQVRGWGWKSVHHPDHVDRVVDKISRCFATGEHWEDTFPLRGRDGKYRWFLSRAVPIRDGSGKIVQWFGTNTDITEQRDMEQAVRDAAERFRTLAEAIPNMVWTATRTGEADYFNPRWYEYTGLTVGASRGGEWVHVVHPDDQSLAVEQWQAAVAGARGVHEVELRLRRADGEYRWFLVRGLRVSSSIGPGRWVGTLTDIHDRKIQAQTLEQLVRERTAALEEVNTQLVEEVEDRKRAEQHATAVARELARSNNELEQFAYVASHDLQEPLRKIQAFGDRLKTKVRDDLPETGKEYVDRMLTSAGRMRRLIEDLLSFSRVTTHARPFARIDLNAITDEAVNDLSERIEEAEAEVRISELPDIEGDPTQMRQLLQNLIANALKFRRRGVTPVVEVAAEVIAPESDDAVPMCRLSVTDNGIGFDEKYSDRIFQVFQRLHGRDEYEGTGVGLAICRKIVERHGGTIIARSRVGEGTSFIMTLPTRQPPPPEPRPSAPVGDAGSGERTPN